MNKRISVIFALLLFGFLLLQVTLANTGDLPQIIIDPDSGKIYITSGYFQNTSDNSGENTETNTDDIVNTITGDIDNIDNTDNEEITNTSTGENELDSTTNNSEYEQAISRMYANGLTMYKDPEEYMPDSFLTREQAAKIIGQLYVTLGYSQVQKNTNCDFSDKDLMNPTLVSHIQNVCKWGLFKGANGKYLPREFLTKPQTIAVLMRMFEGKLSDESRNPRRELYYLKGRRIGIIGNDEAMEDYNIGITRRDIALYVFRLKNIVTNEKLKIMSLNATEQVDKEKTSTIDNTTISDNLSALAGSIDASQDPELQEAVAWMHDNGLTIHETVQDYMPFSIITREQSAKMIDKFADVLNLKNNEPLSIGNECVFDDVNPNDELSPYIANVCKYGFLKGSNGEFKPRETLYKSQFITALIRMLEGPQDENISPWWTNYFDKANSLGIVGPADAITFNSPITRYEVALFFYRLKVKYQMLQNLNGTNIQNEIISTVKGSTLINIEGKQEANIYINSNMLEDGNFEIGYIEIFGNRYKILKTDSKSYFTNGLVRYGDLYDLATDEKIGTVNFSLTNNIVIDGIIRNNTENKVYNISKLTDTSAYYKIIENIQ